MHLDNHRLVFASWRGMETHRFYCHTPVPYLKVVSSRPATDVKVHNAYLKIAQKKGIIELGLSDPAWILYPIEEQPQHKQDTVPKRNKAKLLSLQLKIPPLEIKELPDDTAFSKRPQDHVEYLPTQAKIQDMHHVDNTTDVSVSCTAIPKIRNLDNSEEDTESDSDYQPSAGDQSEVTESDTEEHRSDDEMDLDEGVCILQEEARRLQVSSSTWTQHFGLLSFNPMLNITSLWSSIDGRLLAAHVSHISGLYDSINTFVIYVSAQYRERIEFLRSFPTIMPFDHLLPSRSILLGDFNHNIHTRSSSQSLAQWFQSIHLNWYDPITADPEHNNTPTFRYILTTNFLLITADLTDMDVLEQAQ
ncbi:hypothetical protein G6F58_011727 [Rhizopus delemar]|nr:hypothetical protein G6F58_011727 [Rhizopus delemar]